MRVHEAAGSPFPRYLRDSITEGALEARLAEIGLTPPPPPPLAELYALHDGVDADAWRRDGVSDWHPELLPGSVRFVDAATAARACRRSRAAAEYVGT